jgi:pyoverdine/dityrosine biosynthesis protein Dit1
MPKIITFIRLLFSNPRKAFGYTYLMNKRTMEIHNLANPKRNCRSNMIARKNRKYLTKRGVQFEVTIKGANGCRWCMPELDTD